MPTSLIAPLVSAGVSYGANALFGGGQKNPTDGLTSFAPTGISAGGFTTGSDGGNLTLTPSAGRLAAVSGVAGAFGNQADLLSGLRGQVTPGYNALLASRLSELNNSKTAAIGNLRENLERRRVLGSSFAQDAFTRTNAEFAKQADAVTADSFLKSLDATQQLIGQEFTARRGQFQTGLDELNLEASTAATMAGKATEQLGANARTAAQLDFLSNQGKGSFFNNLIAPVAKAAGNSASGFNFNFGGGSSGPDLGGGIWPA